MSAVRNAETRAETLPEKEHNPQATEDYTESPEEKELLYIETLRIIGNAVGVPGGQVFMFVFLLQFFLYNLVIVSAHGITNQKNKKSLFMDILKNESE